MNVDNEKPTTCLNAFLRELSVTTYRFRREDVLATFFNKFEMLYEVFINQGKNSSRQLSKMSSDISIRLFLHFDFNA